MERKIFEERISAQETGPWFYEHMARYDYLSNFDLGNYVLDIACGNGLGASQISNESRKVIGVDSNFETIAQNQVLFDNNSNVTFEVGNAEDLHFPNEHFSAAVSFETIEHLFAPTTFLKEMSRVIRKNGYFFLSTPNAIITQPIDGVPNNPFHVREYTPRELIEIVEREFDIIDVLGQMVNPNFKLNYYWQKDKKKYGEFKYYIWAVLNRLHPSFPKFSEQFSNIVLKEPLYPKGDDWFFSNEHLLDGHDIVIICKNSKNK